MINFRKKTKTFDLKVLELDLLHANKLIEIQKNANKEQSAVMEILIQGCNRYYRELKEIRLEVDRLTRLVESKCNEV